jgi:glycosyltransferase involved in cell wall biosynthesis
MKKIKIIHLVENLNTGGLEKIVATLAKGINQTKFETEVWCLVNGGSIADQLIKEGVRVKLLNYKSYRNPLTFLNLAKRLKKENVQVTHMHGFFASVLGMGASLLAGICTKIVHVHTSFYTLSFKNILLNKWINARATKVIYVSEKSRNLFLQEGYGTLEKSIVIYNGIDYNPCVNQEQLDAPIISTVASLYIHKGHDILIKAIPEVLKKIPKAHFWIIGKGPLEATLKRLAKNLNIEENITFWGEKNDINKMLSQSSLFVLPSLREGLPISIIEAMAQSKAVIASEVGGVSEIVEDNVTGLIVDAKNTKQLAEKITILLSDTTLRDKMGKNGRLAYENKFQASIMLNHIENVYLN